MSAAPPNLVDDLFRHRYGRMVAGLCRVLGPARLDLAEDVVQEALLRALRVWPAEGIPEQPEAWVFKVARNLALDNLRRQKIASRIEAELRQWAERDPSNAPAEETSELGDDTLRMLFLCSHPAVPKDARVPLILKTVCGFGVPAIAAALLQKEATIAQRLVRAKARLQGEDITFEVPNAADLPGRQDLVLEVLYLVFNEGYRAHRGNELVRAELVEEALRLTAMLLLVPALCTPTVHALLALMLLLGARLPARTDASGELLTLAHQDRRRWHREWLQLGFQHFARSIGGNVLSAFHCEAAIASVHASATNYAATDWPRILQEYDRLLQIAPSPIVELNRAVAIAKVHGPAAGLEALQRLRKERILAEYPLLPATCAQLHWQMGEHDQAIAELEVALQLPCTDPEQRLLHQRLLACRRREAPPDW